MMSIRAVSALSALACALVVMWVPAALCEAQNKPPTQIAGVDNTPMGAYRSLAQLSFEAFKGGDSAKAAELARILERAWDAAEENGGPRSLGVRNKDLFEQVDKAMDDFIKPIMHYAKQAPARESVEAAYKQYLEKLKEGDR